MNYFLNKIVWFVLNPLALPLVVAIVGLVLAWKGRRRLGFTLVALMLAWLWFGSTLACFCLVGLPLERPYVGMQRVETLPQADAIVLLGGGIAKHPRMEYPDMADGADRVWHAARLWKAGKAPVIIASGTGEEAAAKPLLMDFGVPAEAIVVDALSRNTFENARRVEQEISLRKLGKRVLVVTSAWHMTRSLGNFSRTALEAIPAPTDFKAYPASLDVEHWWDWIVPDAGVRFYTTVFIHEWLGRLAKR